MGKFKVGDLVRVKEGLQGGEYYGDLYFNHDMANFTGLCFKVKSVVDNEGEYTLEGTDDWRFSDAMLESVKNKAERTFLEVLSCIQNGEEWQNIKDDCNINSITCNDGIIHVDFDAMIGSFDFRTKDIARFVLLEEKMPVTIYYVEHAQCGKAYSFLSDDKLEVGDFVVCDTIMGRSYGKVKDITIENKTEEEFEKLKKCWRTC